MGSGDMLGSDSVQSWRDNVLRSGGQLGRLLVDFDWAASPLGPIEEWPQSLRTSVSICLASRFPILLLWGPELVMIYNDAYRPMLGASKHPQALGSPGAAIWPEVWSLIGPMLAGVLAGDGATWSDDQLLMVDRNGFLEECYFTFSYSPVIEESGAIGGVFAAVTETTEKVVGTRRLRTLGALAAQLVDSASVPEMFLRTVQALADNAQDVRFAEVYLPQPDGRFVRAAGVGAPSDHRAWPLVEVTGTGSGVVIPLDLAADILVPGTPTAYVLPVFEPGESTPCAVLVIGLSEHRPIDSGYCSFLDLVGGHVGTAFSAATAFEHQRRRAQALAELDAAKSTFFANISHELRTPLTLITGPVTDALEDLDQPLPPVHRERLRLVARNAVRLRWLVNGMLDFARIEAGRLVPDRVAVDLVKATIELAANFDDAMRQAGLTFVVDVAGLPRLAYLDRDMWDRIVLNLLSNALKYTLHGNVTLRLRDAGEQVELQVSDTGVGIADRELPRLFERFHRVAGRQARSHEGSGIGLAMVAELLRLLDGAIEVDSEPDRGTTFTVRLPYGQANAGAGHAAPGDPEVAAAFVQEALSWTDPGLTGPTRPGGPTRPSGSRRTGQPGLLIAEDNRDLREYLSGLLRDEYQVEVAADGAEALELIQRSRPDLVLADVMMPRLDGFGLLAAIRADPLLRDLPVVLLSARAGEEATVEGFTAGADDYLVKPFSAVDLRTRLRAILTRATARSRDAAWRTAIISSLNEGIFIADSAGTVVEVNDAFGQITGWGPDEVPFSPPYPWWSMQAENPAAREVLAQALTELLAEGSGSYEVPYARRDGRQIWLAITASAVQGQVIGEDMVIGTVRDVTEEHELQAAYRSSRDRTELNLRQAIDSHRFIGQAVGILMERHRLTATAAFERLRQASRDRNQKLRVVAEHVIETGEEPARQAAP